MKVKQRFFPGNFPSPLDPPHAPWKQLTPPSSEFDRAVNHFCLLSHKPGHHQHKAENALNMNKENLWKMYLEEYK